MSGDIPIKDSNCTIFLNPDPQKKKKGFPIVYLFLKLKEKSIFKSPQVKIFKKKSSANLVKKPRRSTT